MQSNKIQLRQIQVNEHAKEAIAQGKMCLGQRTLFFNNIPNFVQIFF